MTLFKKVLQQSAIIVLISALSCCGKSSVKPTFGIVPRYGHIPPMPGEVPPNLIPTIPLFVVGPLSRDADDLELALKVLMTPGSDDESANRPVPLPPRNKLFNKFRVAVWLTDSSTIAEIDADVLSTLQQAVAKLRNAGLYIDETARPNISIDKFNELHGIIWDLIMMRLLPLPEWLIAEQKKLQALWDSFFENYDVLLAPVSPTVAFPHNHIGPVPSRSLEINGQMEPMSFNGAWARMAIVSSLPVTVAPVGLSDSGLPVGIQIIGARLEDRTTIAFAQGLSELIGGFVVPPGYED